MDQWIYEQIVPLPGSDAAVVLPDCDDLDAVIAAAAALSESGKRSGNILNMIILFNKILNMIDIHLALTMSQIYVNTIISFSSLDQRSLRS